jgi:hypothetical protein
MINNQKKRSRQRFWLIVGFTIMFAGCLMTITSLEGSLLPDWIDGLIFLFGVGMIYMSVCSKSEK